MTRTARTADRMWLRLFRRFDGSAATLQGQLRDMIVRAVLDGLLQPGSALPSSRLLAETLGLSRTTVTLALEALAAQGLLDARARSGFYVSERPQTLAVAVPPDPVPTGVPPAQVQPPAGLTAQACVDRQWASRIKLRPSTQRNIEKPHDWQQQPYPFVYGQFDASLFPFRDWRSCVMESMQARAVSRWAPDHIDQDDPALVEQIHQRLLPARGIWAQRDQILVTSGAQQGLFLLAGVLVDADTTVGIESPGYPDARNNFALRTDRLRALPVDDQGLLPDAALSLCDYVFVTPSHQCPTTVTLSMQRRRALLQRAEEDDFLLIEDDHESELNFSSRPMPALKSLDTQERVIYLGSLSKTLAHGLRLGFVVAPAPLIRELRALRRLMMRHVPPNNQQAAAHFIAHGHHEAHVRRLVASYRARAHQLRTSLAEHAPQLHLAQASGGSALWATGQDGLDTRQLAAKLLTQGVVVEPGDVFHPGAMEACRSMRIGYSSIALNLIDAGVRLIGEALRATTRH